MIALHALLSAAQPVDTAICADGRQSITSGVFRARVAACSAVFAGQQATRYALCVDDPFDFACALFALFACGKHVVIPASAAPAYLGTLADAYDVLITDTDLPTIGAHAEGVTLSTIHPDVPITLYTSGSTGAPKPIRKTLAQFDAEVLTLEQQWGPQMGSGVVLASVPHHHIYGLLFRVFWPLAAGRAFSRQTVTEPSALQRALMLQPAAALVSSPTQLARWPLLSGFDTLPALPTVFSSGGPLMRLQQRRLQMHMEVHPSKCSAARKPAASPGAVRTAPMHGSRSAASKSARKTTRACRTLAASTTPRLAPHR